jgi:hypothetical protein
VCEEVGRGGEHPSLHRGWAGEEKQTMTGLLSHAETSGLYWGATEDLAEDVIQSGMSLSLSSRRSSLGHIEKAWETR